MIVADASAIVNLVIGAPGHESIADRLLDPESVVHVPHSVDVEVAASLRKLEHRGIISAEHASKAIELHRAMRMERHAASRYLGRMWDLRHNVTAADAAYVSLAEALDAPLITCDAHLARSSTHQARIELV